METVNTFANFMISLAWAAMVAGVIAGLMYTIGKVIQSRMQRRRTEAAKREYGIAGKPIAPKSDSRHRRKAA
jgi:archaellum component FlaG (FlaF/FlaG flagellin family)